MANISVVAKSFSLASPLSSAVCFTALWAFFAPPYIMSITCFVRTVRFSVFSRSLPNAWMASSKSGLSASSSMQWSATVSQATRDPMRENLAEPAPSATAITYQSDSGQ